MTGVIAVLAAVVVLAIVLRVATAALELTRLPRDVARFQVRSAFFGVGFTTSESERVMTHPARRRVIGLMVMAGAIGISGLVTSSVVSLARESDVVTPLLALVGGLLGVFALASIRPLDRALVRLSAAVLRRTTAIEVHGYDALLRLSADHAVALVTVRANGLLVGRPLTDLPGGVRVLGVQRADGTYVDAPPASLVLRAGDAVALYGRDDAAERLADLDAPDPRRRS